MKNSVCLEGHGEILAGRIARPYEKGRPRAIQGDEYWFFIKHFASISKGGEKRERERERETTGKTRALESAQGDETCVEECMNHTVALKEETVQVMKGSTHTHTHT